nr:unnamed protein product [Callosobruchus analis]
MHRDPDIFEEDIREIPEVEPVYLGNNDQQDYALRDAVIAAVFRE